MLFKSSSPGLHCQQGLLKQAHFVPVSYVCRTAKGHLNVEYRDENVRGFTSLAITEQD